AEKAKAGKLAANAKSGAHQKLGGNGNGRGTGNGNGSGSGALNGSSDFGWYHELIHDRFHSQWDQPTSIYSAETKFAATLKIRIERDGTISNASIVKSSGNPVMDESVLSAAARVKKIDPLPQGLSTSAYEININFELD